MPGNTGNTGNTGNYVIIHPRREWFLSKHVPRRDRAFVLVICRTRHTQEMAMTVFRWVLGRTVVWLYDRTHQVLAFVVLPHTAQE